MLRNRKILYLVVLIFFYYFLFYDVYLVPSSSMEPTLLPGDLILIKKFIHIDFLNIKSFSIIK